MCIFLGHVMTNGHVRKLLCVKMKPENDNEEEASITNGISNDVTNVSQISEMVAKRWVGIWHQRCSIRNDTGKNIYCFLYRKES